MALTAVHSNEKQRHMAALLIQRPIGRDRPAGPGVDRQNRSARDGTRFAGAPFVSGS